MSASNEILLDQIKDAEKALAEARVMNDQVLVDSLERDLTILRKRHTTSVDALNEGRTILKG